MASRTRENEGEGGKERVEGEIEEGHRRTSQRKGAGPEYERSRRSGVGGEWPRRGSRTAGVRGEVELQR